MQDFKKGQSTGPKTESGKVVSSQNARKDSIFVQGYLPWENPEEKRQELNALAKQWRANDPTRLMIIQTIQQSSIFMDRIMYAQAKKIEGLMQSVTIADQFCHRAGISLVMADKLPHWFFIESGVRDKQLALQLAKVYDEAAVLRDSYSDQLVAQVEERFPALFEHVMNNQKPGSSFVMILGQQYHQSTPTLNLVKLMNSLKEGYPSHFMWAHDPHRYQIIIDGLRAEQIEAAMDLEKTNRYATNIQNRMAKGISTLAAMDQHECLLKRPERIGEQLADSVQAIDLTKVEVVNESK